MRNEAWQAKRKRVDRGDQSGHCERGRRMVLIAEEMPFRPSAAIFLSDLAARHFSAGKPALAGGLCGALLMSFSITRRAWRRAVTSAEAERRVAVSLE